MYFVKIFGMMCEHVSFDTWHALTAYCTTQLARCELAQVTTSIARTWRLRFLPRSDCDILRHSPLLGGSTHGSHLLSASHSSNDPLGGLGNQGYEPLPICGMTLPYLFFSVWSFGISHMDIISHRYKLYIYTYILYLNTHTHIYMYMSNIVLLE